MDLNVKVAVRCRPLSSKEIARGCATIISMTQKTVKVAKSDEPQAAAKDFTFDHCYFTETNQDDVYRDLGLPLLLQAVDGFNGTIFAYGQTGSGKSHSMMGTETDKGIVPRINDDLFKLTNERSQLPSDQGGKVQFLITVSFLEIYNEVVKDLLNPKDKGLKIRENPTTGIYVEGLCELIVRNSSDLLKFIDQGNAVRRVAATNMNDQSSRSHSCFTIKIEKKVTTELEGGVTREQLTKAKLNLVDLAGSERADKTGATGSLLKEGANINMSLMALGNVINALSEGSKKFVPYRDSKLTFLLKESLGGNALTVMLAAISPADYNYDETLSTLKYANRAKSIANAVTRNEDMTERMIRDLKEQIDQLKQQLATGGGAEANPEMEKRLHEMEASQQNAWEERERLSRALEEERQANMNTVISKMMQTVKEDKVNHMKNIKRLGNEKTALATKLKESTEANGSLKAKLDSNMKRYQKMQKAYDKMAASTPAQGTAEYNEHAAKVEAVASDMADVLGQIEKDREAWLKTRDVIKAAKSRLSTLEEDITNERAELVATASLLDQNDKLRAQIQAEEREKAKEMIAAELAKAKEQLDKEAASAKGTMEEQMSGEMARLRAQVIEFQTRLQDEEHKTVTLSESNVQLQEYAKELENRLVDAEVALEEAHGETAKWKEECAVLPQIKQRAEQLARELLETRESGAREAARLQGMVTTEVGAVRDQFTQKIEMEKYEMFRTLMDGFGEERQVLQSQLLQSQGLFANAVKDIMFLVQENDDLQLALAQSIQWEPSIRATPVNVLPKINPPKPMSQAQGQGQGPLVPSSSAMAATSFDSGKAEMALPRSMEPIMSKSPPAKSGGKPGASSSSSSTNLKSGSLPMAGPSKMASKPSSLFGSALSPAPAPSSSSNGSLSATAPIPAPAPTPAPTLTSSASAVMIGSMEQEEAYMTKAFSERVPPSEKKPVSIVAVAKAGMMFKRLASKYRKSES